MLNWGVDSFDILFFKYRVSWKSFQFNLIFLEESLRGGYLKNILGKYVVQSLKGLLEVLLIERCER